MEGLRVQRWELVLAVVVVVSEDLGDQTSGEHDDLTLTTKNVVSGVLSPAAEETGGGGWGRIKDVALLTCVVEGTKPPGREEAVGGEVELSAPVVGGKFFWEETEVPVKDRN